jgi:D-alanyl-D-alanine carboxypeptidase
VFFVPVSQVRRAAGAVVAVLLYGVLAAPALTPTSAAPAAPVAAAPVAAAPVAAADVAAGRRLTDGPSHAALDPGEPVAAARQDDQVDPQVAAWLAAAGDPAGNLVVVNKRRPLTPADHVPPDLRGASGVLLRAEASDAFLALAAAAQAAGAPVQARSGYRSFDDQQVTYRRWQRALGDAQADTQSARPGHSEHQTGLAVDVEPRGGGCHDFGCFAATGQAAWLAAHAHEFGWVVRYQAGQEAVTGYTAEPWHLRYVGVAAAAAVTASGAGSIEEYLGLPPAPTY